MLELQVDGVVTLFDPARNGIEKIMGCQSRQRIAFRTSLHSGHRHRDGRYIDCGSVRIGIAGIEIVIGRFISPADHIEPGSSCKIARRSRHSRLVGEIGSQVLAAGLGEKADQIVFDPVHPERCFRILIGGPDFGTDS